MNYRHAYHAGNFADVFKHAVLALTLRYLNEKPGAWRFIDTHAGCGIYDLAADAPSRTGEWRHGIARLAAHLGLALPGGAGVVQAPAPSTAERAMLAPYAGALKAANPDGVLRSYPGSPRVARALARPQDRLTLTELHREDAATLAEGFRGDQQTKVRNLDGWLTLGAFVPPKERRGLVLVDPPFEEKGELGRLIEGLVKAHRRWPGGRYLLWYPLKQENEARQFTRALSETGIGKMLLAELFIRQLTNASFDGCGLVAINPPHTLETELGVLLPYLARALAQDDGAGHVLRWITR
jgi:23S rRNA (adenine2030-N6)-methyltransferase